jgi:hypothetical protein
MAQTGTGKKKKRRSSSVSSVWRKGPKSICVSQREVGAGLLLGFLYLTPHALYAVHVRRSWWPVNEFHTGLLQKILFNDTKIVMEE